jgi:hypothetical protein
VISVVVLLLPHVALGLHADEPAVAE